MSWLRKPIEPAFQCLLRGLGKERLVLIATYVTASESLFGRVPVLAQSQLDWLLQ
jgi:hypothetical protein